MEFNADGSLKVAKKSPQDHLQVFHLLGELSFPVGKKLLVQLLRGQVNERIKKLRLDKLVHHGSLGGYEEDELAVFIDVLLAKGFLSITKEKGTYPVVVLTPLAHQELAQRKLFFKADESLQQTTTETELPADYQTASITAEDKVLFAEFDFFLKGFTDEQKKAIICLDARQACIAGAGSGKTSVLTNKIVFLVKYAGVAPEDILAITFTRRARQEMMSRLAQVLPTTSIRVETFNSFAEQELKRHGMRLYNQDKEMVTNKEFLGIVVDGLKQLGFTVDSFLEQYFRPQERRGKEQRQLFFSFLYDFRTILDAYISHQKSEEYLLARLSSTKLSERVTAENIIKLACFVGNVLDERGLRTYADQLVDCNTLYEEYEEIMPSFSWILVDEYQDVNEQQIQLLEKLTPSHLFVVGDPRQSIYAWRGANPNTMYDFITAQPTTILELTTNFRSGTRIVSFVNALIDQTQAGKHIYAPLQSATEHPGAVSVEHVSSEAAEAQSVVAKISALAIPKKNIFVLSRTNKGLEEMARACAQAGIAYVLRTEEQLAVSLDNQIMLSTVHAIKGLEADVVFVIGASSHNYPCRAKDHRFVELLAGKEAYDVYEEERRIFYVACTRAKKVLQISYAGAPSPFVSTKVLTASDIAISGGVAATKSLTKQRLAQQRSALRRWRFLESKERNVPPYLIFSDKVLEQLLQLQPIMLEDLQAVKGFGRQKIEEFGPDILHVMQS